MKTTMEGFPLIYALVLRSKILFLYSNILYATIAAISISSDRVDQSHGWGEVAKARSVCLQRSRVTPSPAHHCYRHVTEAG